MVVSGSNYKVSIDLITTGGDRSVSELKRVQNEYQNFVRAVERYTQVSKQAAGEIQAPSTEGLKKVTQDLEKLKQEATKALNSQANGATALASSLGVSQRNATEFAKSLGITASSATLAVNRLAELDKVGASVGEKFTTLSKEFGINRKQFIDLNASYNQNTKSQEALARSLGVSLGQAQQYSKEIGLSAARSNEAVTRYRELASVGATLSEKQRVLTQELGLTNKQFEVVRGTVILTGQGFATLSAASAALVLTFGSVAKAGINAFVEFDASIRKFGVISEATQGQISAVRSEVERLGVSTSKTPKEIAGLSIELAKTGFSADQVKESLSEIVLTSQATDEGLQRTGEVIGNVINQYQLAVTQTTRVSDLLVATSNSSASGINDLGEALAYSGTQAKQSGQSLEETLFALGQLANAGIKGSAAGTGLAEALRRLKLASASATTELSELNTRGSKVAVTAFKKLNQEVRTADGQLKPLSEIVKGLKEGLQDFDQVDKDLIMNALFGVQGGRVVQTLLNGNTQQIGYLSDALDKADGASKRAADELRKGLPAALARIKSSTDVALISLGEFLSVGLLPLVGAAELLLSGFNSLPDPIKAVIFSVTSLAAALAGATAAIAAYNVVKDQQIIKDTIAAAGAVKETLVQSAGIAVKYASVAANAVLAASQDLVTTNVLNTGVAVQAWTLIQGVAKAATDVFSAALTGKLIPSVIGVGKSFVTTLASVAPFLLIAGLAAGAIASLSVAFRQSEGSKFADTVNKNTDALRELRKEAQKEIKPNINTNPLERLYENIKNKGPITGLQQSLAELSDSFKNTNAAASDFGQGEGLTDFNFITSEQLGAQKAQFALEKQFEVTNAVVTDSNNLLTQYGLLQKDATDRDRLRSTGIGEFLAKSKEQISLIEQTISKLKQQQQVSTNESQKRQIEDEITGLNASKKLLQDRAKFITEDNEALKTNTDRTNENAIAKQNVADIEKRLEEGAISSDEAIAEIEKLSAAESASVITKRLTSQAITKLKKAEIAAIREAIDNGIANEEDSVAKLEEIQKNSKANSPSAAKAAKDEIVKIRRDQVNEIKNLIDLGTINETQAIAKLDAIQAKSKNSPESARAAKEAILKIKKDQIDAEISTIQAGIAATEVLISNGQISEEEGEKRLTTLKISEIQKRIAAVRLESESAKGSEKTKLLNEEKRLQSDIEKVKIDSLNREQKRRLDAIQKANDLAKETAINAEKEREIEVQKLINSGAINAIEAEELKSSATQERINKELLLSKQLLTDLSNLPVPQTKEAKDDLEKRKQTARRETTALTLDLLKAEFEAQERVREAAIKAIDSIQAKRVQALDLELSALENISQARERNAKTQEIAAQKEIAALQAVEGSLNRQQSLLAAKSNLQKAVTDSNVADVEIQLELLKLSQDNDQRKIDSLSLQSELETQLATLRRAAIIQDQANAKQTLDLENRKLEIANKRQLLEAKSSELKAEQAVLDAQAVLQAQRLNDQKAISSANAELEKAQALSPGKDRDAAIASAQTNLTLAKDSATNSQANALQGIELAKQQATIAKENTEQVKEQIKLDTEINGLKLQTLEIENQTALKRFDAAESLRQQGVQLQINKELQTEITRQAQLESGARSPGSTPQVPAPLPARRHGGSIGADTPFIAAEDGPEAIRYLDGSMAIMNRRGVYTAPMSGHVYTAPQTRRMLSAPNVVSSPVGADRQVLIELQRIRKEIASVKPSRVSNSFQIVRDDNPYRAMAEISGQFRRK